MKLPAFATVKHAFHSMDGRMTIDRGSVVIVLEKHAIPRIIDRSGTIPNIFRYDILWPCGNIVRSTLMNSQLRDCLEFHK